MAHEQNYGFSALVAGCWTILGLAGMIRSDSLTLCIALRCTGLLTVCSLCRTSVACVSQSTRFERTYSNTCRNNFLCNKSQTSVCNNFSTKSGIQKFKCPASVGQSFRARQHAGSVQMYWCNNTAACLYTKLPAHVEFAYLRAHLQSTLRNTVVIVAHCPCSPCASVVSVVLRRCKVRFLFYKSTHRSDPRSKGPF